MFEANGCIALREDVNNMILHSDIKKFIVNIHVP